MIHQSHRLIGAAVLALTSAAWVGPAQAQGNPSADQIINSLRPGAGMLGGTRGIRPVAPSAEPVAPAPSTPSQPHASQTARATPARPRATPDPAPVRTVSAPSVNLTVQFATNSADLTPSAVKTLTELGRALSSDALSSFHFRIEGHTDTVGGADTNKALSDRRAQAVVAFLSSSFKIDPSRLEAVGMGEDGLLIQTPPNTPEPRNRRVQVINLGA
jgi:outer membrane protein OmpA-like peptidoglycan-associated protein